MKYIVLIFIFSMSSLSFSQTPADSIARSKNVLPIRGFCISAPRPKGLDEFIKFIGEELASRSLNTLILRVDYNYQYKSHPELSDSGALSKHDAKSWYPFAGKIISG
jgi:hypothetical protein